MDFATLKGIRPAAFRDSADSFHSAESMAAAAKEHIDNVVCAGMRKAHLEGEAFEAAIKELEKVSADFHYAQIECGLMSTALRGFAHDIEAARKKLDAAIAEAVDHKATVNEDGSVSYPPGGDEDGGKAPAGGTAHGLTDPVARAVGRQAAGVDPNPHRARAQDCADRIAAAVEEATRADERWSPKVRALKADDDLTVSRYDAEDARKDMTGVREAAKDYLDSIGPPPENGSPEANAAWWRELSQEERQAYLAVRPEVVGRLDGLPADVRDEANRVVLAEKEAQYRIELDAVPKPPANEWTWITSGPYPSKVHTDEWIEWHTRYGERYEHLTSSLRGMRAIRDRFAATGTEGLPEVYLLGFSAEGNGRAIVATGNPDKADHQAVFVPGTTSSLGAAGGDIERMSNLWRESNAAAGGSAVSTITWLGYDAPQSVVRDSPFRHYADDGAPGLNAFLEGLDTSHSGDSEPHRTAVGHSYGTTLVGSAARQGDLRADDVVFAGSPGVQVGSAQDMDVPRGHVWNEEADGDPVPDIGRWGHGGSQWRIGGGVAVLPSDEVFGAHQMSTKEEGPQYDRTAAVQGHSDYWNRGTTALRNQALVVVGRYGDVHEAE